jgi:hypothetical protein
MSAPPFRFRDTLRLNAPTGVSASTLREFYAAVEKAEPGVLNHHLRETPLRFTFTFWDYPNDFALWAAYALEDQGLAERLSILDPFHERDLEVLREKVLDAVERSLADVFASLPVAPGQEFHFSSSVAVEIDLGMEANGLSDLVALLRTVPATSLYHHLYDARVRNDDGWDDISNWLRLQGLAAAAERLRDLDIYMASLESCRSVVLELLKPELP